MNDEILYTEKLTKIFRMGDREVVGIVDVNLQIKKGESVAIRGPSGSGKTTLLTILGCLDRPTQGKLVLDGVDVTDLSENKLSTVRSEKIGFVFQSFNLMPFLNARENVELPMELTVQSKAERTQRAKELLAMVGLSEREEHRPNKLSAGEQQRVAIARALANRPAILLADEPTGNLDSRNKFEIVKLIKRLSASQGMTVVMVTHDTRIASMAERVIFIKDGKLKTDQRRSDQVSMPESKMLDDDYEEE